MLRQILILLVTLSFSVFQSKANTALKQFYIDQFSEIAIQEMIRSGIPASIILAQGIFESGWGQGELTRSSNNHFGIKCKKEWNGPAYYKIDDDKDEHGELIKSCFRVYGDASGSYIDHTNFLLDNVRYRELFDYNSKDYVNWAIGLKRCGYATATDYAEVLIRIIEKNELYTYDFAPNSQFQRIENKVITPSHTPSITIQEEVQTPPSVSSSSNLEFELTSTEWNRVELENETIRKEEFEVTQESQVIQQVIIPAQAPDVIIEQPKIKPQKEKPIQRFSIPAEKKASAKRVQQSIRKPITKAGQRR